MTLVIGNDTITCCSTDYSYSNSDLCRIFGTNEQLQLDTIYYTVLEMFVYLTINGNVFEVVII